MRLPSRANVTRWIFRPVTVTLKFCVTQPVLPEIRAVPRGAQIVPPGGAGPGGGTHGGGGLGRPGGGGGGLTVVPNDVPVPCPAVIATVDTSRELASCFVWMPIVSGSMSSVGTLSAMTLNAIVQVAPGLSEIRTPFWRKAPFAKRLVDDRDVKQHVGAARAGSTDGR